MNLYEIRKYVCDFVPSAERVRIEPSIGAVSVLACEIGGRTKTVQFTARGLYPNDADDTADRADIYIASDIAQELKR